MVRTRAVQVRLTREQHERLRAVASARGFDTIAGYLRFAALDRHVLLEEKIIAIHRKLFPEEDQPRRKRRREKDALPSRAWG